MKSDEESRKYATVPYGILRFAQDDRPILLALPDMYTHQ